LLDSSFDELDSSFDEFVNAQLGALYRYALVLTGDSRAAEDLVQETLVRVAGGWRRIRDRENASGSP
jgi:DNA-directed RNA polymerase specialized sigma24 family protein